MKKVVIWIGALILGAVLGVLGISQLNQLMEFVATVYTRLFQLLAVPTIVLAVITTFATFGSKGSGRIFGHTITYTLLTTFAAAAVGALLYVIIKPGNLPLESAGQVDSVIAQASGQSYYDHILSVIPNNIARPFLEGNVLSLLLLSFAVGIGLSKLPESEQECGSERVAGAAGPAVPAYPRSYLDIAAGYSCFLGTVVCADIGRRDSRFHR